MRSSQKERLTDQINILEEAFQENSSSVDLAKRSGFTIADLVAANGFGQRLKYHQSVVQDQMAEQQELMERRRQELDRQLSRSVFWKFCERSTNSEKGRSFKERRLLS